GKINFEELEETVKIAVRFLDNVLDLGAYVLPQNKEMAQKLRRVGLGLMGLADALILMNLRYGSEESLKATEEIVRRIRDAAYRASVELAKEKGPFPEFVADKYLKGQFIQRLPKDIRDEIAKYGIRNATILTQAPTGTTSILAGVSSGIEPNFAKEYVRKDRTGTHTVKHWLADYPAFVSAHEVTPEEHVKMQAVLQKYIDSSISKTINLPRTATVDDIDNIYRLAYELGCKGITVYRDGSREGVLVTDTKPQEKTKITERPPVLKGITKRIETPLGRAYVTINFIDNKPFEVFVNIGRAGSDVAAFTEAIARLISLALRGGVAVEDIIEQLVGIGGATTIGFGENRVLSVPDAIGKALRNGYEQQGNSVKVSATNVDICPVCGMATFVYTEGCKTCLNCGYSQC
ncbi:MAG: ribonucleoside-diphosphate reductase alpha chain, partial [Caldanaerobacter sp.]|nr:ribonucleoside-diphosphate reductase alpha chain [Caldanaerobacter sp.]